MGEEDFEPRQVLQPMLLTIPWARAVGLTVASLLHKGHENSSHLEIYMTFLVYRVKRTEKGPSLYAHRAHRRHVRTTARVKIIVIRNLWASVSLPVNGCV